MTDMAKNILNTSINDPAEVEQDENSPVTLKELKMLLTSKAESNYERKVRLVEQYVPLFLCHLRDREGDPFPVDYCILHAEEVAAFVIYASKYWFNEDDAHLSKEEKLRVIKEKEEELKAKQAYEAGHIYVSPDINIDALLEPIINNEEDE